MKRQILFLEDYASGEALSVFQYGDLVAEFVSYETYWDIGAAINDGEFGVHGLFFAIDSVLVAVSVEDNGGVAVHNSNGAGIAIPFSTAAESFGQSTYRDHGSPVAVNEWRSVAAYDVVVNDDIGRTDGHSNDRVSVDISFTYSVFKSVSIDLISLAIYNCYNDVQSSFLVSEDSQSTIFAILHSFIRSYLNISVCVGLISNISHDVALSRCYNFTVFVNNRNLNGVIFISFTIVYIKCKTCGYTNISQSNFSINNFFILFASCGQNNLRTNSCILVFNIQADSTAYTCISIYTCNRGYTNAIGTIFGDLVFNAILINNDYIIGERLSVVFYFFLIRDDLHFSNVLSIEFTESEGRICMIASIVEGYTYSVFTCNEISSFAYILESVDFFFSIPCENEVGVITFEFFRSGDTYIIFYCAFIGVTSSWFSFNGGFTSHDIAILIFDLKLYSFCKSIILFNVIHIQDCFIINGSFDRSWVNLFIACSSYDQLSSVTIFAFQINVIGACFRSSVSYFELAATVSSHRAVADDIKISTV